MIDYARRANAETGVLAHSLKQRSALRSASRWIPAQTIDGRMSFLAKP
jgi:hypothetical protein